MNVICIILKDNKEFNPQSQQVEEKIVNFVFTVVTFLAIGISSLSPPSAHVSLVWVWYFGSFIGK